MAADGRILRRNISAPIDKPIPTHLNWLSMAK